MASVEEDFLLGRDFKKMKSWDRVEVEDDEDAIEALRPESDFHAFVLAYLVRRIEDSEREMSKFYRRWEANEKKVQAYVDLPSAEKLKKQSNEKGKTPQIVSIHVPLTYAIVSTIVTFITHVFCGRRPFFQVGAYKDEAFDAAQKMELMLQYQADHMRFPRAFSTNAQDGQVYGVQITRAEWVEEWGMRTRRAKRPRFSIFGRQVGTQQTSKRERRLIYQGNMSFAQDPFMFFPDPHVPMSEVNRRGEYVFWRNFEGRHHLLSMQAEGNYKWIEAIDPRLPVPVSTEGGPSGSVRSLRADGVSQPGETRRITSSAIQIDEGTVEIIPEQLGLGHSTKPEKWIFTIANKSQIIQAKPFDTDHNLHPVQVAEPYSLGYGFGHLGLVDLIGPLNDHLSWIFNSRMDNVRRVLNDVFVVDPTAIEMPDLRAEGPGRIIRLKRGAASRDVRTVLQQLNVADVTASHITDGQVVIRMIQMLSAVVDNVMGVQDSGGRKTATEVRTGAQGAINRLAHQTKMISAYQGVDTAQTWCLNTQQFLSEDFALTVLGKDGTKIELTPDMMSGDFHFPLHDGTLPLDRVAMLDVWKEILSVTLQDPQLRKSKDVLGLFDFVAELGGAQNFQRFNLNITPDAELEAAAQSGNVVPMQKPRNTMNERPAQRAAEGPL